MQTFTRGETIAMAVQNVSGVVPTAARAVLKDVRLEGEELLEFTVTYLNDLGSGLGAGWLLKATPAQSLALEPGQYATDLRVQLASGDVEISQTEEVTIKRGATENP